MMLYLHGFRSSPRSKKAVMMGQALAARGPAADFICPQLPASPRAAAALIEAAVQGIDPAELVVVGSSLGGFYATWLAERLGCRAALLNPAIRPYDDLRHYIGLQ
ncbi:MAG: YqiA/YcfP family alpha/beta fold hydrolase, partial [Burkholderiaceae bacterium]